MPGLPPVFGNEYLISVRAIEDASPRRICCDGLCARLTHHLPLASDAAIRRLEQIPIGTRVDDLRILRIEGEIICMSVILRVIGRTPCLPLVPADEEHRPEESVL